MQNIFVHSRIIFVFQKYFVHLPIRELLTLVKSITIVKHVHLERMRVSVQFVSIPVTLAMTFHMQYTVKVFSVIAEPEERNHAFL